MRSSRPLYLRVLGVRHLRPGPFTLFLFFEGSFGLALLLALAGLVSPWAMLVIPLAVAVMVKLNDAVAKELRRPLALAQLRTPRPSEAPAVGRSPVPRPSHQTRLVDLDEVGAAAKAGPHHNPERPRSVARGVAPVPPENRVASPAQDTPEQRSRGNRGRFGG